MFHYGQERVVRKASTREEKDSRRVKKRHSTRRSKEERDNKDDIVEETSEKDESPQVARMTAVQKWTSNVEEPVELPFPVGGDVLGRLSVIEEAMKRVVAQVELIATVVQTFDKRLLFEVERRDIVMSSQKDDIEQWKLEAEALVTRFKEVVEGDRVPAVSATVGAVEKDVGSWANVLTANSVQPMAEKSMEKSMAPKEEKPPPPVKVVVTDTEAKTVVEAGKPKLKSTKRRDTTLTKVKDKEELPVVKAVVKDKESKPKEAEEEAPLSFLV